MRCDLAAAFLPQPKVLFLDEPTIGLDVVAKAEVRRFLKEANRELGTTMILTTHDLSDIEELCARVLILDQGKLLYDGALSEIRRRHDTQAQVQFDFAHPVARADLEAAFPAAWEDLGEGTRWKVSVDRRKADPVALTRAVLGRCPVADLSIVPTPIEEIIRQIYLDRGSSRRDGSLRAHWASRGWPSSRSPARFRYLTGILTYLVYVTATRRSGRIYGSPR